MKTESIGIFFIQIHMASVVTILSSSLPSVSSIPRIATFPLPVKNKRVHRPNLRCTKPRLISDPRMSLRLINNVFRVSSPFSILMQPPLRRYFTFPNLRGTITAAKQRTNPIDTAEKDSKSKFHLLSTNEAHSAIKALIPQYIRKRNVYLAEQLCCIWICKIFQLLLVRYYFIIFPA